MVIRIIIAGDSRCEIFAKLCLVADYLSQKLPMFCYDRIEKSVLEWESWLSKINQKNNWHHLKSPLVWKELFMKGSKPYYIGGDNEFFDYCFSYYNFDVFISSEKIQGLVKNYSQYTRKIQKETVEIAAVVEKERQFKISEVKSREFTVCISAAGNPLAMHLISGLLEMSVGDKCISRIYIYDSECSMDFVELDCSYVDVNYPGKIIKYVDKIGLALSQTDLLIILDHVPFNEKESIGYWLQENRQQMNMLAPMINATASRNIRILFPNLGPACFNATILLQKLTQLGNSDVVVATSDMGLGVVPKLADITEVPTYGMFCPPVWGFVGVNHLVDVRTTVNQYFPFDPNGRFTRVKNSSLTIGTLIPKLRTMEHLIYFDKTLWMKMAQNTSTKEDSIYINKAIAVLDIVKLWLFGTSSDTIVNLGIFCNGSFGLNFKGIFSQPAQFLLGAWTPASHFPMPRDSEMKLPYMAYIAELMLTLKRIELPKIISYWPCSCKVKYHKKKLCPAEFSNKAIDSSKAANAAKIVED